MADRQCGGRAVGAGGQGRAAERLGARVRGAAEFPLLAKFIFPEDKLSIQVHPDDHYAREHEALAGGRGKTEMWYAVAAGRGEGSPGRFLRGGKPGAIPPGGAHAATGKKVCRGEVFGGGGVFVAV